MLKCNVLIVKRHACLTSIYEEVRHGIDGNIRRAPGISNPISNIEPATAMREPKEIVSAHGSMNHFAFNVAPEKIAEYRDKLIAKGLQVSTFMHHDASPSQLSETVTESVWISSI